MPAELEPIPSLEGSVILPKDPEAAKDVPPGEFDPQVLKDYFKQAKQRCFDGRWVFERQWLHRIYYVLDRQWIRWDSKSGGYVDKRLAKWIPRPTNPDLKNGVMAIRAMLTSSKIGVNARPAGADPQNIATAATADELAPVLHEAHDMNAVMTEADWWFIVTGNTFLYTYIDYDFAHGSIDEPQEQCATCGEEFGAAAIAKAQQMCPACGGVEFQEAINEDGTPKIMSMPKGKAVTRALSPLEIAFSNTYPRFKDVPEVILMRWRTKSYYEQHADYKSQVAGFNWQKAPSERSMQIFKMMPQMNDMGMNPFMWGGPAGGGHEEEGAPEYELWIKPCGAYPKGCVARFLGDSDPIVLTSSEEALPGPFPYTDAKGQPLFTITHAGFEHVGGRILAAGALDGVVGKLDQLNQLDSMMQMIIQRMANPVWLEPKGAEVEKFTGEPGLVVKWNPLTVGGNAKPERLDGSGPHPSLFQLREQYKRDIEEGMGSYDVLKGNKPSGVDSFSGMQLLVERSQSRFANAFQSRGEMYRDWFSSALELEREFGPNERTQAVLSPGRQWTFQTFKNADLQGAVNIIIEDGSTTPKTNLGVRASVEHLHQLGIIDKNDPDQRYEILRTFGQTRLVPSLDIHMQAALRKQQAFEEWLNNPAEQEKSFMKLQEAVGGYQAKVAAIELPPAPPKPEAPGAAVSGNPSTGKMSMKPQQAAPPPEPAPLPQLPPPPSANTGNPLEWQPWWVAPIHKQEFMKWANGDKVTRLLVERPEVKELLVAHMADIDNAIMLEQIKLQGPQPPQGPGKPAGGGGAAMANSNRESGSTSNASGGDGVPKSSS